ncbi:hypothetical protein CVT25_009834 [Psilocybe cyanescens]|uniref:Uncharacterized protein n=1 Tax=Psilocybe cyanescens TaxID=93625 RepID=A0A409X832_PSICY|nr:hypothetical protein CVT25_009834 [Psilocybe cyanescens]
MNGSFAYIWEFLTKGSKRLLSPGELSQKSCKNAHYPPTSSNKNSVFQTPGIETLVEPRRTISEELQEYKLPPTSSNKNTVLQTPHEGLKTLVEPRRTIRRVAKILAVLRHHRIRTRFSNLLTKGLKRLLGP